MRALAVTAKKQTAAAEQTMHFDVAPHPALTPLMAPPEQTFIPRDIGDLSQPLTSEQRRAVQVLVADDNTRQAERQRMAKATERANVEAAVSSPPPAVPDAAVQASSASAPFSAAVVSFVWSLSGYGVPRRVCAAEHPEGRAAARVGEPVGV